MKLTIRKLYDLFAAFKKLNGAETVVAGPDGKSSGVVVPYQFDGKTCYAIARNMTIIRRPLEDYETARVALVKSYGDDPSEEKTEELLKEVNTLLGQEVETKDLFKLKLEGLKLDTNPIQPGILSDLTDYIEE